ncbi:type IV pilus modification protein PilV [Lacisediminimonas profundi]|uniref:type IV pilus modification protein PilV n=1 Tax=Lacisediminimonas profundi TaxID=2603856 RepID=UPI00124B45CB|nr:type IV pilus modification protein PilV [Lacisediminimonas profundi]
MRIRTRSEAGGFTVIEILVCLFVLSIVVICAAGVQLQSSRLSRHSAQFSHAAVLAGELAERIRMRSRLQSGAAGATASAHGIHVDLDIQAASVAADPDQSVDCHSADCSLAEMEQFELQDWQRRVAEVLPGARALVCGDASPWSETARRYEWGCSLAADGNAPLLVKLGWRSPLDSAAATAAAPAPSLVLPVD